jgi:hypothetical protein
MLLPLLHLAPGGCRLHLQPHLHRLLLRRQLVTRQQH